jgi:hypothetical protein
MASQPDEPSHADVQRAYPGWACWRAISGLLYARPADAQPGDPATVKGEDPLDLRDQIRRAEALDSYTRTEPPESGP